MIILAKNRQGNFSEKWRVKSEEWKSKIDKLLSKLVDFWQRAVKRCVNTGKNSKKYTKPKLFKASKKVRFVLWNKRLHICFTHAKRNYTFRKMSVIIRHDIYLKGVFWQFLFILIFILLGFFCKINYVRIWITSSVFAPPVIWQSIILNFVPIQMMFTKHRVIWNAVIINNDPFAVSVERYERAAKNYAEP